MASDMQTCPNCKTSKYNNPQLRLMVNLCGHSLCENCVEVLFVRGSGLCVECKTPIRKANFRYQLFEDPAVQKEVDIRKKVTSEFNKREEDFETIEEYDAYLEMVEDIIYKLTNDVDIEKTKKFIEQYKKENKDVIKRNRSKQSNCAEFYERELEHERINRERIAEKQAAEDALELKRRKLQHAGRTLQGFLCGASAVPLPEEPSTTAAAAATTSTTKTSNTTTTATLASGLPHAPPSAVHRFLPPATPASSLLFTRSALAPTPASVLVGAGGAAANSPFLLPSPANPLSTPALSSWATSAEHHSVVIPTTNLLKKSVANAGQARKLDEWLEPFKPEMCGPAAPPTDPELVATYLSVVVEPTTRKMDGLGNGKEEGEETSKSARGTETSETQLSGEQKREGVSRALPNGAAGIAPEEFLKRALEESRWAMFI